MSTIAQSSFSEYEQRGRMSELKQLAIVEKRSAEQLARPGKRSAAVTQR